MEPARVDALRVSRVPTVPKVVRREHLDGTATKLAVVTAEIGASVKKIRVAALMDVQQVGRVTFAVRCVITLCMEDTASRHVVTALIPPTAIMSPVPV